MKSGSEVSRVFQILVNEIEKLGVEWRLNFFNLFFNLLIKY